MIRKKEIVITPLQMRVIGLLNMPSKDQFLIGKQCPQ